MHIPTVTDQQLDKVIECASSPVAIVFFGGPDRSREGLWRWRLRAIADDWDDRIIFLFINAWENPVMSMSLGAIHGDDAGARLELPVLIVFRRGVEFGRCIECARPVIDLLLGRSIKVAKEG